MAPRTEPAPKMLRKDCPLRLDDVVCGSVAKGKLEPAGVTAPMTAKATAGMTAQEPQLVLVLLGPIAVYRLRNESCKARAGTAGVLATPVVEHCTRAEHANDGSCLRHPLGTPLSARRSRPPGRWQP